MAESVLTVLAGKRTRLGLKGKAGARVQLVSELQALNSALRFPPPQKPPRAFW
jgi:hypothetical protein